MSLISLHTTEHAFDDVPWHGDGEPFDTMNACNNRIRDLSKMLRDNEISITVLRSGEVVKRQTLKPKVF